MILLDVKIFGDDFEINIFFVDQIYFADLVSKSANYCWATEAQPKVRHIVVYLFIIFIILNLDVNDLINEILKYFKGILVLAEVALGTIRPAYEAYDYADELKLSTCSFNSIQGIGRMKLSNKKTLYYILDVFLSKLF